MKKILLSVMVLFSLCLVACTQQNISKLEGNWYYVYDGESELGLEIKNGKGQMYEPASGVAIVETDEEARHVKVSDNGFEFVLVYDYVSDDELEMDTQAVSGMNNRIRYYRENSQALEDAINESSK